MNYNKVVIMGRLSQDIEVKQVGSTNKASTSVAVNHGYKDKRESYFFSVEAWGNTSDRLTQFWKKGMPILIEGRLKQESWSDQSGQKKSRILIVAESVHFVSAKEDGEPEPTKAGSFNDSLPF